MALLVGCGASQSGNYVADNFASASGLPTAAAGANVTVVFPTDTVTLNGSGTDTDGTIVSYRWRQVSGPGAAAFANANAASTVASRLAPGTYVFQLVVTDNDSRTASDTLVVTVVPAPPNNPPRASAGVNQTITLPVNSVTLTGSGTDPDGTIAGYQWTQLSGPGTATFSTPRSASTVASGLVAGSYAFKLEVTDDKGAKASDSVIVTVNAAPPRVPPVSNAGPNRSIVLPVSSVVLNGSGTDSDGTITGYLWTQLSGPNTATLANANTSTVTASGLIQGSYVFQLTVTDNHGLTGSSTASVAVSPPNAVPPVANAGAGQSITLPVNSIVLRGAGSDPDGTIAGYMWSQVSGPNSGTLTNANTATVTASALIEGTYTFRLTVTDNQGLTGTDTVTVIVNPAPNLPPTASAGANQTITLPMSSVSLNGSGTDSDGTIAAYAWSQASGPNSANLFNATTATLTATGLIAGTYIFTLVVRDNDGAQANDSVTVTVNPQPANVLPSANAGANQAITLPTDTVTFTGSGTDSDGTIASYAWTQESGPSAAALTGAGGAVVVAANLVEGTYVFKLTVTDDRGGTASDTVSVMVNPAPNQVPVANAGVDQNITLPTDMAALSGSGSDPDGAIVSYLWAQVSGPAAATFSAATSASTDATGLAEGTYVFRLTVTDDDGATDTDTVSVIVAP